MSKKEKQKGTMRDVDM